MVAEGQGVALLTELSIDHSDPRTATVELGAWLPARRVGLAWHPEQAPSPALQSLVATAREATRPSQAGPGVAQRASTASAV